MSDQLGQPTDERTPSPDVDVDLIDYLLSLTPAERIERHDQARELVHQLRAAGRRLYGFDPGSPEEAD